MDFELPPDPYVALGISKNATSAEIKKAWQKLILKCHPDKVTDDAAKARANEEFQKVQSAYELISDEAARERYHAQLRIHELRKQNDQLRNGQGPRYDVRTAAFDVRTAAPPQASYTSRGPPRYHAEERKPGSFDDEEPPRGTTRKHETSDYAYVRRPSAQKEKEKPRAERVRVERMRTSGAEERKKAERRRDAEVNESRARKYETRLDEFVHYEEERRKRDKEDVERRKATEASRPAMRREETYERTMLQQQEEAVRYMAARSVPEEVRASSYRGSSSRESPRYDYVRLSAGESKESSRKAREGSSPKGSPPRESKSSRRTQENADPYETVRPPPLKQHNSAPPKMAASKESREPLQSSRGYSSTADPSRSRGEKEGPPMPLPRTQTMPSVPLSGSGERTMPSKLRTSESATAADSGWFSSATSSQPATTRTTYHYPSDAASPSVNQYQYSNGHRVEVRAPPTANTGARRVTRSPSPISPGDRDVRTSATAAKMAHLASSSPRMRSSPYASYPDPAFGRPSFTQTSSAREVPRSSRSPERSSHERERGRERRERYYEKDRLSGDSGDGRHRTQPTSYRSEDISFSKRYTPEDVVYSTKERSRERYDDRSRPSFSRSSTAVY